MKKNANNNRHSFLIANSTLSAEIMHTSNHIYVWYINTNILCYFAVYLLFSVFFIRCTKSSCHIAVVLFIFRWRVSHSQHSQYMYIVLSSLIRGIVMWRSCLQSTNQSESYQKKEEKFSFCCYLNSELFSHSNNRSHSSQLNGMRIVRKNRNSKPEFYWNYKYISIRLIVSH